jgi:hypothetical protein
MNPIQLLAPQSLRVIGQSNGLATIELSSSPNGKLFANLMRSFTFSKHISISSFSITTKSPP